MTITMVEKADNNCMCWARVKSAGGPQAWSTATRPTDFPHLRAGFNDKLDRSHTAILRGASLAECEETKAETTSSG